MGQFELLVVPGVLGGIDLSPVMRSESGKNPFW